MKSTLMILSLIYGSLVFAAPTPPGIMVNGKLCSKYNGGDEFYKTTPGKKWKVHIANFDAEKKATLVKVGNKTCNFQYDQEEKCCKELGLKYVQNVKMNVQCGPANTTPECSFDFKSNKKPDTK